MKKLLGLIALLVTIAPSVQAQEGFYAGGYVGANFLDLRSMHHTHVDTDAGYALGGVVGYKFCNDFRLEGEVAYRTNGFDKLKINHQKFDLHGHAKSFSFMTNAYYDLSVDCLVVPYVGAGIGYETSYGHIRLKSEKAKFDVDGFSYQAMAGLNYDLTSDIQANLEYKFHRAKKHSYDNAVTVGMKKFF